jgi:hypothetical protein
VLSEVALRDKDRADPLAFELEADEIERRAVAAGLVEPDRGNLPRCRATNAKGRPCRSPHTLVGADGFCAMHLPGDEQENRRRRRQGGRKSKGALLLDDLPALQSPQDAERWLEVVGRAVATGVLPASKGQVAASCVRAWLSAHEQGKITDQVADLSAKVAEIRKAK